MLLQASMNNFKKWFLRLLDLKTLPYKAACHWVKKRNVRKKEYIDIVQFCFCWKMTNNFKQPVTQWDFCACFLGTISDILGTAVERGALMSSLGINRDRYFLLISLRRTLPHTDMYPEWHYNFKCAFRQRWKLFSQSTPKIKKSQLQNINSLE